MSTASPPPQVVGYVAPLSAASGERLAFKISSLGNARVNAEAIRFDCCDPNPDGPGMKLVSVDFGLAPSYDATEQSVHLGSCAVGSVSPIILIEPIVVELIVKPTVHADRRQTILSLYPVSEPGHLSVSTIESYVVLHTCSGDAIQTYPTNLALPVDWWSRLTITLGVDAVEIAMQPLPAFGQHLGQAQAVTVGLKAPLGSLEQICIGAVWDGYPIHPFDGVVEAPHVVLLTKDGFGAPARKTIARWDFSIQTAHEWIPNQADPSRGLTLINLPMRAVRSSGWSGRNMDWNVAPDDYAAIYFHSDDLGDCGWDTTIDLLVPPGTPSGVYGLRVENGKGADTIPFYVRPGPDSPRNRILFLASTFTYMAYGNHARGNLAGALRDRIAGWSAYPHNPDEISAFGLSTYNRHPDGTGISLSSRLRPLLTMRPGYLTFFDPKGSGLRHFSADSHITDWLRVKGFNFDVITDEDLDDQGIDILAPYDIVITGTHPEYQTRRTIEALIGYRLDGGKLVYLGGNGFYWKIARAPHLPHVIEIRRAECGVRVWSSRPGEYYNQLDGEYGGLWRRNGVPPQLVAGVGFTAEGDFEGTHYRRTADSFDPSMAFLFDGIAAGERIGDFGLSGGGAAGFEIDQAAGDLGTPDFVKTVAVSEGHGPSFYTAPEELLLPDVLDGAPRQHSGIHATMVCGTAPNGGALFAAGSITFAGSLSHNNYDNNVSRILQNCLQAFLAAQGRRR